MNDRSLGLAATYSALGNYFFVATQGVNGFEMVDAYARRVVGGVSNAAGAPDGLVLDDSGRLYVHGFLSRTVAVFDVSEGLAGRNYAFARVGELPTVAVEKLSEEVLRGKRIFYDASDRRMARDGYISCATCHLDGFEDGQTWDFTDRGEGLRNTTYLLGRRGMGHGRVHWSANFDEIQDFEGDIRFAFGGIGFLSDKDWNAGSRRQPLGDAKAGLSPELDDLAAYVASLDRVGDSPHRDPDGTLTPQGWSGREIFVRIECSTCHGGPDFTDSASGALHDVGTILPTSGRRLGDALTGIDTPTLRGVWQTAPYLHDGSAATIREVLVAACARATSRDIPSASAFRCASSRRGCARPGFVRAAIECSA